MQDCNCEDYLICGMPISWWEDNSEQAEKKMNEGLDKARARMVELEQERKRQLPFGSRRSLGYLGVNNWGTRQWTQTTKDTAS